MAVRTKGHDGLAGEWRHRVRRRPGGALALKAVALLIGLTLVSLGVALAVLPGPLTIPPVLLGLYVLSLEFVWADRLLDRAKDSGREAWGGAKQRPVRSTLITVGGLTLAAAALWALNRYDLLARVGNAVGL